MNRLFLVLSFLSYFFSNSNAQSTYNAYAQATVITSGTVIGLANANVANHSFTVGGQVIVMQMQDNVIGTNTTNASTFGNLGAISNAGNFEVRTITSVSTSAGTPTRIAITPSLSNTYNTGSNSRVQVITFRRLSTAAFTTTNSITGTAWNGTIGGVIALEVGGDFVLNHSVSANALGFRGGTVSTDYYGGGTTCNQFTFATSQSTCGYKGESIYAVTSATQTNGIAKVLNGGGGGGRDINGGGGGGGNYTTGGAGGNGWNGTAAGCTGSTPAGQGGITLSVSIGPSRVFMGGGGGGGQQNNTGGSNGGRGGGIILIKANRIVTGTGCSGSPVISANGATAGNATNDGAGGGGAAGSIVLQVNSFSVNAACPLSVRSNGGSGGNVTDANTHAGGGAGAQGVVIYSSAQPTSNVTTQTNNGTAGCSNSGCSVSAGSATGTNGSGIVANSSGVLPVALIYFSAINLEDRVELKWKTASEINTEYFLVKKSVDGVNWVNVSKVGSAGNSTSSREYLTNDNSPTDGLAYYQLITVNSDETLDYHNIEYVNRNIKPVIKRVYPNPASSYLIIEFGNDEIISDYKLIDLSGRSMNINITEFSSDHITLDLSSFEKGVYILNARRSNGITGSFKVILH